MIFGFGAGWVRDLLGDGDVEANPGPAPMEAWEDCGSLGSDGAMPLGWRMGANPWLGRVGW